MSLPILNELLDPTLRFGIGVDDKKRPVVEALPPVGAGAAGELVHPLPDLVNVSPSPTIVVVDHSNAPLGEGPCFVNQDMFRTFLKGEAFVGIGEDEITARELIPDSLKPRVPLPAIDRLGGKSGATEKAGLLYRLNRAGAVVDDEPPQFAE